MQGEVRSRLLRGSGAVQWLAVWQEGICLPSLTITAVMSAKYLALATRDKDEVTFLTNPFLDPRRNR